MRLLYVLNHDGMWGVDGGAYLLSRNAVLGQEPTGTDFMRPPFAPGWIMVAFTALWGDNLGVKLFHVASFLPMIGGFLVLAGRYLKGWQLTFAVFLVLFDLMLAEMFTAGALPMWAFGALLLAFWSILGLSEHPRPIHRLALLVSLPAIAALNQTTAGIAIFTLAVFTTVAVLQCVDKLLFLKRLFAPVLMGTGIAVAWLLPYYTEVSPGSGLLRYPGPLLGVYAWPTDAAWVQFAFGMTVTVLALWRLPRAYRPIIAVLFVTSFFGLWRSYDETVMNVFYRSRYLENLLLAIVGVPLVWKTIQAYPFPRLAWGAVGLLMGLWIWGFHYQVTEESHLGQMVTKDSLKAFAWLQENGNGGLVVTNSYSYSLYLAAITKLPTIWTQVWKPPRYYAAQHDNTVCLLNWKGAALQWPGITNIPPTILGPVESWETPDCTPESAVVSLAPEYVLIERYWPQDGLRGLWRPRDTLGYIWGVPTDPWARTDQAPWLEEVQEWGTTKLWRVRDIFTPAALLQDAPTQPPGW